MKKYLLPILSFFALAIYAQPQHEKNPPENIKSIVFSSDDNRSQIQFPLVRVGESFTLQFDDLNTDEAVYYYQITHFNHDWTPSTLLKSEYIKGMDDQYLQPEANSYATLQPYSHYRLTLPNNMTRITLTGNYLLTITDDRGNAVFSRRFVVYNPIVSVLAEVKRSRELTYFDTQQVVQFSVKEQQMRLQNPNETVKAVILQNYRWDTAISGLKPQYTLGNELIYRYDRESAFWAGNEYLNFENKDIRMAMTGVHRVEQNELFEHILFTNISRANRVYTYFPDINGNFLINTVNGQNIDTEADYSWVYFSLEALPDFWNKEVYVYGKFSNYELSPKYRLFLNEKTGLLEGKVLMKQGFYNYNFAVKDNNSADYNLIGGNFHQTENAYLILIYYRPPGALYDQVVGVGNANSNNITR